MLYMINKNVYINNSALIMLDSLHIIPLHARTHSRTHTHTQSTHRRNVTSNGASNKKTYFEITCIHEFLTQFWRHGRTECNGCQKGPNSIAVQNNFSRRNTLAKCFCSNMLDTTYQCVCRRMNLPGRGVHSPEGQGNRQETSQRRCDR